MILFKKSYDLYAPIYGKTNYTKVCFLYALKSDALL